MSQEVRFAVTSHGRCGSYDAKPWGVMHQEKRKTNQRLPEELEMNNPVVSSNSLLLFHLVKVRDTLLAPALPLEHLHAQLR